MVEVRLVDRVSSVLIELFLPVVSSSNSNYLSIDKQQTLKSQNLISNSMKIFKQTDETNDDNRRNDDQVVIVTTCVTRSF